MQKEEGRKAEEKEQRYNKIKSMNDEKQKSEKKSCQRSIVHCKNIN